MGLPPDTAPAAAPAGSDPLQNTLTRAEFDALPFADRNHHIRQGGKVRD
jgi:hypothetical protein